MVVVRNKSSRSLRAAYLSEAEITFLSGAAVVGTGAGAEGWLIFLVGGSVTVGAGGPSGSAGKLSKAAVSKFAKLAKASVVDVTARLEDAVRDVDDELVVPSIAGEVSMIPVFSLAGGLMTGAGPPVGPGLLMEMLP